ncbi:MAG: hypothetical protein GX592_01885 [Clostridiales bacterium]|nr:hypothetical protein [Clostridiales bacterium]
MNCPRRFTLSSRELVVLGLSTALLFAVQIALAALPNIEMVSLLIVLYTRRFRWKTLLIIYAFALLEGAFYGFGFWFINYLYVWTILWSAALLLAPMRETLGWVVFLAAYGLFFGVLCSIPYLFVGGPATMLGYILSGIPFDLVHAAGNAAVAAAFFKPLDKLMDRLNL